MCDWYVFSFSAETLSELRKHLKEVIDVLTQTKSSVASVSSGCELFLRFITLAALDSPVSKHKKIPITSSFFCSPESGVFLENAFRD